MTANFMNRKQLHSFGRYVLNRWARFTPTIVGFLAFTIILSMLGDGPLFHQRLIAPYVSPCFNKIWRQLTFTNNLGEFQHAVSRNSLRYLVVGINILFYSVVIICGTFPPIYNYTYLHTRFYGFFREIDQKQHIL